SRLGDTSRRTSRDHGRMSSTNPDSMERERLGGKFWIGVVLAAIACGVGAILAFALFGFAWAAFGLIGAIIVFVATASPEPTPPRRPHRPLGWRSCARCSSRSSP